MDISTFTSLVVSRLADGHEVTIAHLGTFSAKMQGAAISPDGRQITPPRCQVLLRAEVENTSNAVKLGIRSEEAACVQTINSVLDCGGSVMLPGLGKLEKSAGSGIAFTQADNVTIFPDLLGLKTLDVMPKDPEQKERRKGLFKSRRSES